MTMFIRYLKYSLLFLFFASFIVFVELVFNISFFNKKIDQSLKKVHNYLLNPSKKQIPSLADKESLKLLQNGNNTIFMLHTYNHPPKGGDWERSFDLLSLYKDNLSIEEIRSNSCLKPKGIIEAKKIKDILSDLEISITEVYSSPMCRNIETAELAFGKIDAVYEFLLYPDILPAENIKKNKELTKKIFYKRPVTGNKVIISHGGILTSYLSFSEDIKQSGMLVYNHDKNEPILQMDYLDFVKMIHLIKN